MNWQEALSHIESPVLDAKLNMVSSTSTFLRAARKESAVQKTLQSMQESGERREEVLGRICDLAMLETDPRYENPNDTPLAILLWLTCYTEPDFARLAANLVERSPRCWYAHKVAHQITNPHQVVTSITRTVGQPTSGPFSSSSFQEESWNMIPHGIRTGLNPTPAYPVNMGMKPFAKTTQDITISPPNGDRVGHLSAAKVNPTARTASRDISATAIA